MTQLRRILLPAVLALGWTVAVCPCMADGLFYYVEDDGRVVVTNTLEGRNEQPLPGIEPPAVSGAGSDMPATLYDPFIERVAVEYGVAPGLIKAVALVESGFDPHAVSHKGAEGLMQLMPATAEIYGVKDSFDPLENLRAGTRHLRRLLDEFGGDVTLALAAYNAGSGAVRRHGGVPTYPETRRYVSKVHESMGRPPRPELRPPAEADPVRLVRGSDGTLKLVN